jgi:hypothetical protein
MPNWCNNTFELVGPTEKIREFEAFLEKNNGKDWFDFFAPCPQELKDVGDVNFHAEPKEGLLEKYGYSDWYSFGLGEWGCKWNCDAQDWTVEDYDEESLAIKFWFDSPWGPPEELYNNFASGKYGEDYHVFAEWHEEGMAFIGRFDDGFSENYEYSDLDSLDEIPEDLLENWNIREMLEEREEWDDEDESDSEESDMTDEEMQQALDELKEELAKTDEPPKKWPN